MGGKCPTKTANKNRDISKKYITTLNKVIFCFFLGVNCPFKHHMCHASVADLTCLATETRRCQGFTLCPVSA